MDTGITMLESFLGFILGSTIGLLVAILFTYSALMEKGLYGYFVAFKAVPLVAIAPILAIWFGSGLFGKVVMSATICFFPAIVNGLDGLRSVDCDTLDLMQSLSMTQWDLFRKVRLWSALPYLFSAFRVTSTLSVVGSIVAEMASSDRGIGHLILVSSYRNDTVVLFASIICVSVATLMFFGMIAKLESYVVFWKKITP